MRAWRLRSEFPNGHERDLIAGRISGLQTRVYEDGGVSPPVDPHWEGGPLFKKSLVVSSDDLGMSWSVNQGIDLAYRKRALTSTNFMVVCPWFEHCAKHFSGIDLDLGVHLTLTCEWSNYTWRPLTSTASLLNADGRMHSTIAELMAHATVEDIKAECRAQIVYARQRRKDVNYVDLHMCIPSFEKDGSHGGHAINPPHERVLMQVVQDVANEFELPYPYALEGDYLKHFDSVLSISGKGRAAVEQYIRTLQPGMHHLSCHCAVASGEQANLTDAQDAAAPWALDFRVEDLEFITSDWFRLLLLENEVQLTRMPFTTRYDRASCR